MVFIFLDISFQFLYDRPDALPESQAPVPPGSPPSVIRRRFPSYLLDGNLTGYVRDLASPVAPVAPMEALAVGEALYMAIGLSDPALDRPTYSSKSPEQSYSSLSTS